MFKYVNEDGNFNIATPRELPKHKILEHRAGYTHNRFTYSNGLVIETIVEPHKIQFFSSHELEKKSDGKYHPKL
ncbi:hypothetical protein NSA56_11230 [Oceanobacillus caeni]|uniref:hypothetical protein n=1 Tax=Oceanobacillus caeni TaxID=405946 RepID=UPI00214A27D2|nr:hypothetical protein [Oceanobacillus caeni]MCR1834967.1 hypothetical protein [Oceanobacillus caeni]